MAYLRKTYIRLGRRVSPYTQTELERTIPKVLTPISPGDAFVSDLEQELIVAAKRQQQEQVRFWRGVRTMGMISGGLLSVIGGVFMWIMLRQRGEGEQKSLPAPQLAEVRV